MKTAIIGFDGYELTNRVKNKLKLAIRDAVKNYAADDFLVETKGELYEYVRKCLFTLRSIRGILNCRLAGTNYLEECGAFIFCYNKAATDTKTKAAYNYAVRQNKQIFNVFMLK